MRIAGIPQFDVQQLNLMSMGLGVLALAVLKLLFPYALALSPISYVAWYLLVLGIGGFAMWGGTHRMLAHDGQGSRLILAQWLLLLLIIGAQIINATELFLEYLRPFQEHA